MNRIPENYRKRDQCFRTVQALDTLGTGFGPNVGKGKGKGKVVPVLFLTKHHDMEAYWERRGIVPSTLDVTLGGGEWLASRPGSFTPNERPTGIHWIGA